MTQRARFYFILCLCEGMVLAYLWLMPLPRIQAPKNVAATVTPLAMPRPEQFDQWLKAPIMRPDRRPINLPMMLTGAASQDGPFILKGLLRWRGVPRALLQAPSGAIVTAFEGDWIDDWHIQSITATRVEMINATQSLVLEMSEHNE